MGVHDLTPEGMKALKKLVSDGVVHPDTLKAAEDGGLVHHYADGTPDEPVQPDPIPNGIDPTQVAMTAPEEQQFGAMPTPPLPPGGEELVNPPADQAPDAPGAIHGATGDFGAPAVDPGSLTTTGTGEAQPAKPTDYTQGLKDQQQAYKNIGQLESQKSDQTAKILEAQQKQDQIYQQNQQKLFDQAKSVTDQQMQSIADYQKTLGTMTLDPHRYLSNMSTGGKIASAIAIALGGMAGGVLKTGGNVALDIINQHIQRDLEAQKFDYEKQNTAFASKQSFYSAARQGISSQIDHSAVAYNAMLQSVQRQVQVQALKSGSPLAVQNAKLLSGQIQSQIDQKNYQIHMMAFNQNLSNAASQGGVDPRMAALDPQMAGRQVVLPTGKIAFAGDTETAKSANDDLSKIQAVQDAVNQWQNFHDKVGSTVPYSTNDQAGDAIQANLRNALMSLGKSPRFQEYSDKKLVDPLAPHPGELRSGPAQAQIEALKDSLDAKRESVLKQSLPGYRGYTPKGKK